ncbi:MAG TPA: DNA replication and repair protein RecF [Nevskiaceae bacterium]
MSLVSRIEAYNLRALANVVVEPGPRVSFFYGDNGAGKTSLAEALLFASRGCGAAPRLREVMGPAASSWRVTAEVRDARDGIARIHRLAFSEGQRVQEINGRRATNVELARSLPLGELSPPQHAMINAPSGARLRWINWCAFHVEPTFYPLWLDFRRCLKQRNAVLRKNVPGPTLRAWTHRLAAAGERLNTVRWRSVVEWVPLLREELETLQAGDDWSVEFRPGWDAGRPLDEQLDQDIDADLRLGTTRHGPHRADIRIGRNGRAARRHVSRGEEKLGAIALLLAVSRRIQVSLGSWPVLVFDDLSAELSRTARLRVLARLAAIGAQVFVTGHEKPERGSINDATSVFHVEHGHVERESDAAC